MKLRCPLELVVDSCLAIEVDRLSLSAFFATRFPLSAVFQSCRQSHLYLRANLCSLECPFIPSLLDISYPLASFVCLIHPLQHPQRLGRVGESGSKRPSLRQNQTTASCPCAKRISPRHPARPPQERLQQEVMGTIAQRPCRNSGITTRSGKRGSRACTTRYGRTGGSRRSRHPHQQQRPAVVARQEQRCIRRRMTCGRNI